MVLHLQGAVEVVRDVQIEIQVPKDSRVSTSMNEEEAEVEQEVNPGNDTT
jgi:hypothetical protein